MKQTPSPRKIFVPEIQVIQFIFPSKERGISLSIVLQRGRRSFFVDFVFMLQGLAIWGFQSPSSASRGAINVSRRHVGVSYHRLYHVVGTGFLHVAFCICEFWKLVDDDLRR